MRTINLRDGFGLEIESSNGDAFTVSFECYSKTGKRKFKVNATFDDWNLFHLVKGLHGISVRRFQTGADFKARYDKASRGE